MDRRHGDEGSTRMQASEPAPPPTRNSRDPGGTLLWLSGKEGFLHHGARSRVSLNESKLAARERHYAPLTMDRSIDRLIDR